MNNKSRGLIYILVGTIIFIIGLTLVYEDQITLGVVISGIAAIINFTGFSVLSYKDPEKKAEEIKQQREAEILAYINSVVISTIVSINDALSTNSKYINQRATAKLDYSIYSFMQFYYMLCASKNTYFLEVFSSLFMQKIKYYFSSMMEPSKIERILDERIDRYDYIMNSYTGSQKDELMYTTAVDYIAEDLYFASEQKGDIFYEILELDNIMISKEEASYLNLTRAMSDYDVQDYN